VDDKDVVISCYSSNSALRALHDPRATHPQPPCLPHEQARASLVLLQYSRQACQERAFLVTLSVIKSEALHHQRAARRATRGALACLRTHAWWRRKGRGGLRAAEGLVLRLGIWRWAERARVSQRRAAERAGQARLEALRAKGLRALMGAAR
jgi:hypothetical protein